MTAMQIGDRVRDPEGDWGKIVKLRPPEPQVTVFGALPGKTPAAVLVEWETLGGGSQPVAGQVSWESASDLKLDRKN